MPTFRQAREFLLANRTHYDKAVAGFQWPEPVPFNWALDWFDAELAHAADSKDRCALWIVDVATGQETRLTFAQLKTRSNQVANYLRQQGLKRGDHLLLVLNNVAPLWEIMLAAMKLGVVVIPATTLLTGEELADRVERGRARMIVADEDQVTKCAGLSRDGVVFVTTSAVEDRRLAAARRCLQRARPSSRRMVRPTPTTLSCSISPRARPPSPSWCGTAIAATRWARCRRCTGWDCSPATCT